MADIDILDLFGGGANPRKKPQVSNAYGAPVEMVSEFLVLVDQGENEKALDLCISLLELEPRNKLFMEYRDTLQELIKQEENDSGSEDSDSDSDSDSEGAADDNDTDNNDSDNDNEENDDSDYEGDVESKQLNSKSFNKK